MPTVDREKDTIICDLDGTIALDHERARKHLHQEGCTGPGCLCKRDWNSYFAAAKGDTPNWTVIDTLRLYWEDGYNIRILTGRSESIRDITEEWLSEHAVPHHSLVMRPAEERLDDHILKPRMAIERGWTADQVKVVFEDRQRVVDAWRALGFTVFQVAPGNF